MAATTGAFSDAEKYALRNDLPIRFVIEDNGMSCDSPTDDCWGEYGSAQEPIYYRYVRTWPHAGIGRNVF
jgi:hypothetical protein